MTMQLTVCQECKTDYRWIQPAMRLTTVAIRANPEGVLFNIYLWCWECRTKISKKGATNWYELPEGMENRTYSTRSRE